MESKAKGKENVILHFLKQTENQTQCSMHNKINSHIHQLWTPEMTAVK